MSTTSSAGASMLAQHRGWFRAVGVTWIALGLLAVAVPLAASIATELLIGALLLVGGIGQVANAFRAHGWGGRMLSLALGALYAFAGLMLLASPLQGLLTLTVVLAACLLVGGIVKTVLALRLRPAPGWGSFLLSGLLGVALGLMLWLGLPSTAPWAIGTLVGIDMIFAGAALWAAAGVATAASA